VHWNRPAHCTWCITRYKYITWIIWIIYDEHDTPVGKLDIICKHSRYAFEQHAPTFKQNVYTEDPLLLWSPNMFEILLCTQNITQMTKQEHFNFALTQNVDIRWPHNRFGTVMRMLSNYQFQSIFEVQTYIKRSNWLWNSTMSCNVAN